MPLYDSLNLSKTFRAQSFKQLNAQLNERVRQAHLKTAALILVTVATVVAIDVASNKYKPTRYRDYSYAFRTGIDFSFNYFDAVMYNQLSKRAAREGLERSFMFARKIGPNESHIGAVYFPRFDDATELLFNFKTSGQDFKTLFRQTIQVR